MPGQDASAVVQIAACRTEMATMAAVWCDVARASEARARAEAEVQVFNEMVVALEGRFLRQAAGNEPDPVNEVRLLARGVTCNGGYFPSDHTIRWRPEVSVTGYRAGDRIRLDAALFRRLAGAYLDALTAEFAGD
ncbi:hypothetical protein GC209_10555 [bacterium]|nr:hypothetical protein [bacterium]